MLPVIYAECYYCVRYAECRGVDEHKNTLAYCNAEYTIDTISF